MKSTKGPRLIISKPFVGSWIVQGILVTFAHANHADLKVHDPVLAVELMGERTMNLDIR